MLKVVFTVNLNAPILAGRVAIGKFDGKTPSIVAATTGDKVLVHNGKNVAKNSASTSLLNINQTINSLATGQLKGDQDILVIGTPTSIFVYDVQNNSDLFYRDIPDGANVVTVGRVSNIDKPLAIAGGNCALQGFNYEGSDSLWTVTGDNITSLALADINGDNQNELLVGSEDYDIRVFKEDTILFELSETGPVTFLCPIMTNCFAYALANGTVGVYHKQERLWRIKSKNQAVAILSCDINGDGIPELVTAWTSGKVDGRNIESGEVLFKDNFNDPLAGLLISDYNMDGIEELIVISVTGEVRGYVPTTVTELLVSKDLSYEQDIIRDLMKKRQYLALELRNYEENVHMAMASNRSSQAGKASTEEDTVGSIPANTQLSSSLAISSADKLPAVQLTLTTTNDTIVRTAIVFAEGIFSGESFVVHPSDMDIEQLVTIPFRPPKDIPVDLHIKALVGYKGSHHYHVFEMTRRLPKFSMYTCLSQAEVSSSLPKVRGYVRMTLNEKCSKVVQWLNKNFLLTEDIQETVTSIQMTFSSLRDAKVVSIEMNKSTSNELSIRTDSMEIAGDMVQSLVADHLKVQDMASFADFPLEVEHLKRHISKVEEIQTVRQQLSVDIADSSAAVRTLVVRAEDARLLGEFRPMKGLYGELNALNRELISEYKIRSQNHQDLVNTLKQINVIIQKAGNLRVGQSKTRLIQSCRLAIKQNNMNTLAKIIMSGDS
ncbi:Bardet-Biedl syndrome 2 protein [Halotydeus destructor]|nr:Bardet-Biedl syndrome 2 protein [Halotydeus destructor]